MEIRSLAANRKMWAMLTDLANQVEWPVDGRMQLLSPGDWKQIMTAGWKRELRVAQGIDGGFVVLGHYTHNMTRAEMSELIELMYAFGAERGVKWSEAF
jgi:hypothetical protein